MVGSVNGAGQPHEPRSDENWRHKGALLRRVGAGGHNSGCGPETGVAAPPVSRQRLDELSCEIDRIADLLAVSSEAADDAIRAFNAMTGHDYVAFDFAHGNSCRRTEFPPQLRTDQHPQLCPRAADRLFLVSELGLPGRVSSSP